MEGSLYDIFYNIMLPHYTTHYTSALIISSVLYFQFKDSNLHFDDDIEYHWVQSWKTQV